ncbi:E3 ubiquitin-protein ligase listerin [Punica granatum]|uniref:E3 ubiquitin-protein ligase listerin n=1 Tax=Punica granatum TaxID=22663 RepID=A0A6P8EAN6_PUNGR|nr:E3 ubiquitin-protein ligase listerin [Punica granatum]XP_031402393.1 E3 ubiquitin-protein ligase listerin [Punica granatum]
MGRQKGDAGRSKARPSSSSLAASLLPADSTASVGFGGYVGSSRLHSSLAGSRDDASPYSDIDSELAQHLKRLARKDPTTKLKALASLSELFKQKSGKDILPAIPQWGFEYKRLLLDYNREVRRATGDAMAQLVIAVGRDLAPHLKSLMGPWWFSQFDTVPEASQAAKHSLQAAFPAPEKRLDALILCTTEIFTYLEENLKLTPQDLSDKASAPDELKEMHQQVISSSMLALATLLDVLISLQSERPGFENIAAEPKHAAKARAITNTFAEKLFSNHRCFLDFLKSQSSAIRSAAYSVLKSFMKNMPHVFIEENVRTLSPVVLGAFQEKDPTCHPSMWEVILLFSRRFPNCWTYLNVQKIVMSRFWHFLRNGCFGSHQVSYPALVIFLDSVPPKAIEGERFLQDFFLNFWTGRNASLSSNADRLAFFQAFKECFLWALHNLSRYLDGVDSISPARAILVENILVKLLWEDFVHFPLPNDKKRIFPGISCETSDDSNLSVQRTEDASIFKHPVNYIHELGKCIIGILSGIALVENDLPSVFGSTFQETCQQMLMHSGNGEGPEIIEQLIQFLSLLEQHAMRKGETWPLVQVLGPTVAKHFSSIKSIDAPNGVRFLSAAVTVFGARQIVHALLHGHRRTFCSDEQDKALESKQFMHIFNERFVPWCFGRSDSGTAARIDFLLTLLDDECFPEQWSTVVSYAVKLETTGVGLDLLHPDCVAVLSILLHKVRGEITRCKRKRCDYSQHSNANCWHNKLLDSAAVAVISSLPPFQKSAAEFLCSALGGATENDQIVLVSGDAFVLIYNNILEKLIDFILVSPLTWVKEAGCLLRIRETNVEPKDESFGNRIEMAKFALDVLSGSLYALTKLDEESELPTHILAAVFIISWECSIEGLLDEALSYELDNMKARFDSSKTVQSLCSKINKIFCQNLGVHSRKNVRIILAQSIRCTIFREQKLDPDKLTALCCTWMLAIVDCFCQDEDEEQHLLEQLLHQGDGWPLWCSEDVFIGLAYQKSEKTFLHRNVSESNRFVSLVDKLIQKRGIGRVIGGSILDPHCTSGRTVNFTSRAWLAAEILCTWEWPGGSAVTSFLPMLSLYAKNDANPLQEDGLLDSILDILLDAALVQEKTEAHNFSDAWIAPLEGLEHTEEPFLRALISLLATFFRHNIWGSDKAKILFELLVSKLFIGETVNIHCLRILPPIVSALVQPIFQSKKELNEELQAPFPGEDKVQITIIHWLERALSFPPLLTWHSGQDMEEWLLLVISCYPMNVSDRLKAPKPEWMISIKERTLLLDLFRKQRLGIGVLTACDHLESSQMLLSRLVAISSCYCGDDFAEEDWDFVLSQVKLWIQLAVVMMEDVAENVNDLISNLSTGDYLDNVVSKIENIVFIKDQFHVNIARNAILAFISFSRLQEVKDVNNLSSLAAERWDTIKDRILEAILRLFFCTGLAEAIAHSYSSEGASIVASSRLHNLFFWNLVAWGATGSSPQCRDRAVKSVDFWALGRGSISSLYAILFSSTPVPAMQFAGYVILSTEPVASVAIGEYVTSNMECDKDSGNVDLLSEQNVHLRKEISCMIEKSPYEILEMDLLAPERVHILLSWCILLSHLWSLPLSSPKRERLVQHIQNSANTVILDCLFQHLFLEFDTVPNLRKREKELPAGVCEAANVANEAILTGSVLSIVESFWPVQQQKMTLLAGAIFGMMVRLLPAYVRGWFSNLRDRSTSSAVESFTRTWCSPPLIANELSQIKKASFVDENFSVSVSKAANEVVATYTKDETGVDLVIRLPASYPLRAVDVDCTRSLGISELKQRKWLMSMMLFLSNQNGAIAEAIRIWKCNFDKEFEGVEECPICYSVIHTANHSLPRVACKTCKHKYHSACLNKWFSTSNKRNCPLCQSLF